MGWDLLIFARHSCWQTSQPITISQLIHLLVHLRHQQLWLKWSHPGIRSWCWARWCLLLSSFWENNVYWAALNSSFSALTFNWGSWDFNTKIRDFGVFGVAGNVSPSEGGFQYEWGFSFLRSDLSLPRTEVFQCPELLFSSLAHRAVCSLHSEGSQILEMCNKTGGSV